METKRLFAGAALVLLAATARGYELKVDTVACNAGTSVAVDVSLDDVSGLAYANARIVYDPQVLVLVKAEEGTLAAADGVDFVAVGDEAAGIVGVGVFGDVASASGGGTIARLHFAVRVRDATEGLFSDVTIAQVDLGDASGVRDLTLENPVCIVNGMVRVMTQDASVKRLEAATIVAADTRLGSLTLAEGDAIRASDSQTAIRVAGEVSAAGAIPVRAPVNGWASGRYAILATATQGLLFALDGIEADVSCEVADDVCTYYATVAIDGELPVVCDSEELSAGNRNLILANAKKANGGSLPAGATSVKVSGPAGIVALIADMGIAPAIGAVDEAGVLQLTFAEPKIDVTEFDPATGLVRFKVTPGAGNKIVGEIATGYVHVYGTDDLAKTMRYVSHVAFDLTGYLKAETKGEGVLTVTLGTHTFLKIKVETVTRQEGDAE